MYVCASGMWERKMRARVRSSIESETAKRRKKRSEDPFGNPSNKLFTLCEQELRYNGQWLDRVDMWFIGRRTRERERIIRLDAAADTDATTAYTQTYSEKSKPHFLWTFVWECLSPSLCIEGACRLLFFWISYACVAEYESSIIEHIGVLLLFFVIAFPLSTVCRLAVSTKLLSTNSSL
jgi:hypothetical protein